MSDLRRMSEAAFADLHATLEASGIAMPIIPFTPRIALTSASTSRIEEIAAWCRDADIPCAVIGTRLMRFLALAQERDAAMVKMAFA